MLLSECEKKKERDGIADGDIKSISYQSTFISIIEDKKGEKV